MNKRCFLLLDDSRDLLMVALSGSYYIEMGHWNMQLGGLVDV